MAKKITKTQNNNNKITLSRKDNLNQQPSPKCSAKMGKRVEGKPEGNI